MQLNKMHWVDEYKAALAAAAAVRHGAHMAAVHRLDFDLGLHRLAAAANGGGSGDYTQLYLFIFIYTFGRNT